MRIYSLANPRHRRSVDLRKYSGYIEEAVKNVNPSLQVVVEKNCYAIPDTVGMGEIIKIGRAIAKTPLGSFCLERPILFVGTKVECDDIFDEYADDEDE